MRSLHTWTPRYPWLFVAGTTVLLTSILYLFTTPLFNSGDDVFLMYTAGGGFGEPATNLLHYTKGWNFILTWFAKSLFVLIPGLNGYTVLLLLFHVAGYSAIFYALLKQLNTRTAILFFLLLFIFIATKQLLSLTYTGAALVAAIGACSVLLRQFVEKNLRNRDTYFAFTLLLLAGMLRLPVTLLVVFLFSSLAIILLERKWLIRALLSAIIFAVCLWGLDKIHEQYYIKHIPGWKQQEKFRQSLFAYYNKPTRSEIPPGVFADSIEQQLFFAGFLYDSARFSPQRVKEISQKITTKRSFSNRKEVAGFYWFFLEVRVYLLLLAILLGSLLLQKRWSIIKKWLLCFLAVLAIHIYLFIFLKMTMPLHMGLLLFLFVSLPLLYSKSESIFLGKRFIMAELSVLLALSIAWMWIEIREENNMNRQRHQQFLCAMKELKANPGKLFIVTDDAFPISYSSIWDTPKNFPAENLLYKDRLINKSYRSTLERHGVIDLEKEMITNPNLFLVGSPLYALEKGRYPARLSAPLSEFRCIEARRLTAQ